MRRTRNGAEIATDDMIQGVSTEDIETLRWKIHWMGEISNSRGFRSHEKTPKSPLRTNDSRLGILGQGSSDLVTTSIDPAD